VKIAIVGVGSVGKTLLRILQQKKEILERQYLIHFQIVLAADSSGVICDSNGIDISQLLECKEKKRFVKDLPSYRAERTFSQALEESNCKIMFESSPVNLKDGNPGLSYTESALQKGISVVLANKGILVFGYHHLHQLAKEKQCKILFSATVCGGLPIVNVARYDLIAANITKFRGVFNATSNFILGEMAKGGSYEETLKYLQERGIAETNPSLDVEGWDTANKLLICCFSILHLHVSLKDIRVQGITKITNEMIFEAKKEGKVYKLIALAEKKENGTFDLSVNPTLVPLDDFLALCSGFEMGVEIFSDLYERMSFKLVGEDPPTFTASSMLRDAVNIVKGRDFLQIVE